MKIRNYGWWAGLALILVTLVGMNIAGAQPAKPPAATPAKPPAATPAATKPAATGGVINCKVAFVDLARVLDQINEGQKLKKALEAEKQRAMGPLKAKQDELEKLEQQISALTQEILQKGAVWDQYQRATKQNELMALQQRYNTLAQTLQIEKAKAMDALAQKKDTMLKPLEDKLNKIMEDIGKNNGYCMILDVSPPSPNLPNFNPILYRDPAFDITDQVIAAVDK
jgi:Skp family chaperone for outer membrane proteins